MLMDELTLILYCSYVCSTFRIASDRYGPHTVDSSMDPQDSETGSDRVFRGGSWYSTPANARSANRNGDSPDYRNFHVGFRLARSFRQ